MVDAAAPGITHLSGTQPARRTSPAWFRPELMGVAGPRDRPRVADARRGGVLVGFGSRWAGGCTSGHAISGLAAGEWPSLIAVLGFFVGGLLMTHALLPMILATS